MSLLLTFWTRKMAAFANCRARESVFRQLRQSGIGANPKKAAVISKSEENHLWVSGILGCSSPITLQRTVFFYLGKNFCLRGGEEQRELKPSQLLRMRNPDQYVYVETGSKNRSGGLKELNVDNEVVPIYACPGAGERCLVYLLDFYLSKLPSIAFEKDVLYWSQKMTFQRVQKSHGTIVSLSGSISLVAWWRGCVRKQA